ncbi:interleukin enhancer-binding factor 2 homolog [Convolutriloba macropyga]|uniref:interleukin enhancer-binding factor 2 homolog n=1 Tax=Convolutriloba macropyga TaxID=536237 RepID=UPI003F524DD5
MPFQSAMRPMRPMYRPRHPMMGGPPPHMMGGGGVGGWGIRGAPPQSHQPPPPRYHHTPQFVPHLPFDPILCEPVFPRVTEPVDDSNMNAMLLKRHQDVTPSPTEQANLLALVQKVQSVLDNLVVAPPQGWEVIIEEVRQVGSFKKGTICAGHNVADMVVVLKILPTIEAVNQLGRKVCEEVQTSDPRDVIHMQMNEGGCEISNPTCTVNLMITTGPNNLRQLDKELHLDYKPMVQAMAAIRHTRWFDENATHSSIKVLVRLLKDLRSRFVGLEPMNPWIIDLIAHYCIMNNPSHQPLPLAAAYKRVLQILSAGFFLPGSLGMLDPCEAGNVRVHTAMTLEQQDQVCYTSQTLLRVLAQGGMKKVIGIDPDTSITETLSVWNQNVVVSPSVKAYEPPQPINPEEEKTTEVKVES